MYEKYFIKDVTVTAEKLDTDIVYTTKGGKAFHLQAGNYLIKGPGGRVYPANKELFEYLFEREETNE